MSLLPEFIRTLKFPLLLQERLDIVLGIGCGGLISHVVPRPRERWAWLGQFRFNVACALEILQVWPKNVCFV